MRERIGPVQSTSSVPFFGIEIKGDWECEVMSREKAVHWSDACVRYEPRLRKSAV
jgi:hypothetical protein